MSEYCSHVGFEHPFHFQCSDCEDNAMDCNCSSCMGVYCPFCDQLYWTFNCDDVCREWINKHSEKDMELEALKIQGLIKDYELSEIATKSEVKK